MKIAYFDGFPLANRAVVLAALVDASCDVDALITQLRRLPFPDYRLVSEKVLRAGIAVTQIRIASAKPASILSVRDALDHVQRAQFAPPVAKQIATCMQRFLEAETQQRQSPVDASNVFLPADALLEIVSCFVTCAMLEIERCVASPLCVGPSLDTPASRLDAALLSTLIDQVGPQPEMITTAIGMGAANAQQSTRDDDIFRVLLGDAASQLRTSWLQEDLWLLEALVDDLNPQIYGYVSELALQAGALDVYCAAIQPGSDLPGHAISLLCAPEKRQLLAAMLLRETTATSLRQTTVRRFSLAREHVSVNTRWGSIRMKVARQGDEILNAAPEYEDCKRAATEYQAPIKQVMAETAAQFWKRNG
jgi:uncharacterized protein (DUF111 family)